MYTAVRRQNAPTLTPEMDEESDNPYNSTYVSDVLCVKNVLCIFLRVSAFFLRTQYNLQI